MRVPSHDTCGRRMSALAGARPQPAVSDLSSPPPPAPPVVSAPFVIDHFRNGVQTSRINYESIEFNKPLADSLFAKPANIKAIK